MPRPAVQLLEAGREPQRVLRFSPSPGRGSLTVTLSSTMSVDAGTTKVPPTRAPALRSRLATQTRIDAEGNLVLHLKTESVEVLSENDSSPALAAALEPTRRTLEQLEGEIVLDRSGTVSHTSLTLPEMGQTSGPSELERLRTAFSQTFVTLPSEPIGVGARWAVTSQLPLVGASIEQRTEYTLRELDGDRLQLDVSLTQRPAPSQPEPIKTSGIRVTLDRLSTTGTGEVVLDLGRIEPVSVKSSSMSTLTQTIDRDGQRQQVEVSLSLELDARSG